MLNGMIKTAVTVREGARVSVEILSEVSAGQLIGMWRFTGQEEMDFRYVGAFSGNLALPDLYQAVVSDVKAEIGRVERSAMYGIADHRLAVIEHTETMEGVLI